MVWDVPQLIARATRNLTLQRGDVILTGSRVGLVKARPDDTVEVVIDGIGGLENHVGASAAETRDAPTNATLEGQPAC